MNNATLQIFELSLNQAGTVPGRVHILPVGPKIQGRDGRTYYLRDPQKLVDQFNEAKEPTPVDYEHGSEIKSRQGEKALAAGWVRSLEYDPEAGVFANIDWTPTAANEIKERAYRYISPAVIITKSGEVKGISSLGLVHKPNLELTAINRKDDDSMAQKKPDQPDQSNDSPAYLAELGLEDGATPDQITQAIKDLKAQGGESQKEDSPAADSTPTDPPPAGQKESTALNNMVPRADYDALAGTVKDLQKQLGDMTVAAHAEKVETALNSALQQGKIVPASVDYHRQCCMKQGGLEAFQKFMETAPSLAGNLQLSLNNQNTLAGQETETPEDKLVKSQLGIVDQPATKGA